jgi:acetyl-CoA carboxylase biotin carboxylase subunit
VKVFLPPGGPGVRIDSHLYSGYTAPANYDSLLGKIMASGQNRSEAIARMKRALAETIIVGPATTISFHKRILEDPRFEAAEVNTALVERWLEEQHLEDGEAPDVQPSVNVHVNGKVAK